MNECIARLGESHWLCQGNTLYLARWILLVGWSVLVALFYIRQGRKYEKREARSRHIMFHDGVRADVEALLGDSLTYVFQESSTVVWSNGTMNLIVVIAVRGFASKEEIEAMRREVWKALVGEYDRLKVIMQKAEKAT